MNPNNELIADFENALQENKTDERPVCIVKLTTSYWHDGAGCHVRKDLRFLKRKCQGFNILMEDCDVIGASDVMKRITNLNECKDGTYHVMTCNESHDWETPHIIDDYDYKLIPYEENGHNKTIN